MIMKTILPIPRDTNPTFTTRYNVAMVCHNIQPITNTFCTQIAPYTNCVVTGAYWDKNYPRLMTNKQLADFERLKKKGLINKGKMMSLADIVCDVKVRNNEMHGKHTGIFFSRCRVLGCIRVSLS